MSPAADRLEDTYPHGSVAGYRDGCRDGNCPAPLACRDVNRRYAGDYGFRKMVDAGVALDEILRRDAAEREGIEQRDKAAARAARTGVIAPVKVAVAVKPAAKPTRVDPSRSKPAPAVPAPAPDPFEVWQQERDVWRARRRDLYRTLRSAEQAIEKAIADRDRAQVAFEEFAATGEPQKSEKPKKPQRADVEAGIRRLHAAGLSDAETANELGITTAYAGIVRRDVQLPANIKSRRAKTEEISAEHHGTAYGYQLGCRSRKICPAAVSCADASLAEERRRRRESGVPAIAPRVNAEPARAHVRALMAGGMTLDAIASTSGVPRNRLGDLLYGRSGDRKGELATQIDAEKAQRILALEVSN